jgi:hypothetical protein
MANSIDITERCLPVLKTRGCAPAFLPFTAYSRPQVLAILSAKLSHLRWPVFDPVALELVARKVGPGATVGSPALAHRPGNGIRGRAACRPRILIDNRWIHRLTLMASCRQVCWCLTVVV